jgi:hypothetical protein
VNLLDASMQFPTVVFTIGLLIALVYWLFVILGALDIDLFGGVDDAAGAMKGAGDAVTGGIKGAAEAATGAAKGGAEALKVSPDADLWDWIGLGTLPVTVSASAVLMLGWSGSILAMHYGDTGSLGLALKLLVAAGILLVALPLAGLLLRPLRPVFEVKVGKSNRDYVGATCTITTGHVDADFGQATIEDAGGRDHGHLGQDHRDRPPREGGPHLRDNIRADIKVTFFVRVNKTVDDVLKVAQSIGCARASDQKTLEDLFTAKFSEALKTVGKQLEFEELYKKRDIFRDQIISVIGKDLNGFVLDDAAIDYLEQTPLELLDPHNILDAQGIKKITDITTVQNVDDTNELRQKERMDIGSRT